MEAWLFEQAEWLTRYSAVLVLLVMLFSFLEVIVPLIPGVTFLMAGSTLAATARIAPIWLVMGASLGTFAASLIWYQLGSRWGESLLDSPRFSRLLDTRMFLRIKGWFSRYGYWTLLVSRLLPIARSGIVLAAGIVQYDKRQALTALSISIVVSSSCYVMLGYTLGKHWRELFGLWKPEYLALAGIGCGLILLAIVVKWLRNKHR